MMPSVPETETVLKGLDHESRQMVIDTVRQFKKRILTKETILKFDKEEIFPEEIVRSMLGPDIGLQLIFIPEAYGGLGGGARDCFEVIREISSICLGIATGFFAVQLGSDPLLVGATEEQKKKWLGAIAQGDCLVAYAVTEAGAGSNLAAFKTKAEPVSNNPGEIIGYKINGTKQFISTGGYADFITLLANTPEGPSFFVVEKGAEGFVQGKGEEKHGIRASNTSPLSFTDVFVPVENLIGGVPGEGMKQANKVFGYTRLMVAAMGLGAGNAVLDIVIPYARERIQFGSPLSEKQGYTHKLIVPNVVNLEAALAYAEEIAIRLDSGEEDLQVEGAIAKLFATESANKTADDGMQALGGYGYIREFEVEKIKRDVKITCIYEGTSEILQNIISTFRWKKTRKSKGAYYMAISSEMEELDKAMGDAGCRFYGLAAKALNDAIMLVNDNRLTKQQYIMFALADMMTHVEVGASMARKAMKLNKTGNSGAEKIKAMSRIFANNTAQLVAQNILKILQGPGVFGRQAVSEFMERVAFNKLICSHENIIKDMDMVADILFERS
ncbi:MAG: acyl-CoA dehydrogenase family protein [Desulfobacterales bacterium]|uniref:Acyl-CoA dehydrogenase family protein n=1 Tax=Candidatus Desulfaltia bathyphila TaxID=2841697 RepID=A0A8J6T8M9_9BACT|nr:acyl-CoA dehydrogenase family protein [Candidatus Desulfaltia bathyphila]MBL7194925.1 acyl-CoA dehydrogenase family protein [Desulfobacterales bacterium]MBL7207490.1 acyl-CoA dehydrogenase family protein [Desulfobacterales bacterium]